MLIENYLYLLRFKVQVLVSDHTSEASFVIFDSEAIPFLGKTAQQLREELIKVCFQKFKLP